MGKPNSVSYKKDSLNVDLSITADFDIINFLKKTPLSVSLDVRYARDRVFNGRKRVSANAKNGKSRSYTKTTRTVKAR